MSTDHNTYQELIIRALAGEISAADRLRLESWLARSDENRRIFEQYKAVWSLSPDLQGYQADTPAAFSNVLRQIEAEEQEPSKTRKLLDPIQGTRAITRLWISGMAATLLILLATSLFFFLRDPGPSYLQATAENETKLILLEDESQVHLKAGAGLSYPSPFGSRERRLKLTGNAYFEVASNQSRPFVVQLNDTEIRVLATAFYVEQDLSDYPLAVSVTSGKVSIRSLADKFEETTLEGGQRMRLSGEKNEIITSEIEDMNFLAWKTGTMSFEDAPLRDVFNALGQNYSISVEAPDEVLELRLTARFIEEDYQDIMSSIALVFGLELSGENKRYTIKNSHPRDFFHPLNK